MTIIQAYKHKVSISEIRSAVEFFLITKINANPEVFEALSRMGTYYGGNIFPARQGAHNLPPVVRAVQKSGNSLTAQAAVEEPTQPTFFGRFSVLYLYKDQHRHLSCPTYEQARDALTLLLDDRERTPIGIYDDKTELFEWEHSLREEYEKASMKDQGRRGEEIIHIAQALRRRDWDLGEFRRPSLFA